VPPRQLAPENRKLASIALTVATTAVGGIFGAIPASMYARRASEAGEQGRKYWKAFWVTLIIVSIVMAAGMSWVALEVSEG
jgi:hypothetical protein